MKHGYARVSTCGQSVDTQVRQLRAAGCEKLFRETASGAEADRAVLREVLATLGGGFHPAKGKFRDGKSAIGNQRLVNPVSRSHRRAFAAH
jgi:hypothetical protein